MSEDERRRISGFIETEFGIRMPPAKQSLLEGRLGKRVIACGLDSFGGYFDYVTGEGDCSDEYWNFIDLISTHETSFFRESRHFEFLLDQALPDLLNRGVDRSLSILSAGCSTGEEAYSLGMLIDGFILKSGRRDIDFRVEGFDLSARAVEFAARGIFASDKAASIPEDLKRRYLMRGTNASKGLCRFVPELRERVSFHCGNLLGDMRLSRRSYDVVFCRNVLIYFDRSNQNRVVHRLASGLEHRSYLFLGHSETMLGLGMPLLPVSHSVYRKG